METRSTFLSLIPIFLKHITIFFSVLRVGRFNDILMLPQSKIENSTCPLVKLNKNAFLKFVSQSLFFELVKIAISFSI